MREQYSREEIAGRIHTKYIGKKVFFYECTDSTNVRARLLAEGSAEHGTLVVADKQTAGRGRRGRDWESPAGKNIYFTLILKPDFPPDKASMLTLVMAMAVARGIEKAVSAAGNDAARRGIDSRRGTEHRHETAPQAGIGQGMDITCGIKWPNDLVINGKKICGILTEMSVKQGRIGYVIIGVGINVGRQEFAPELVDKATDIETECGQAVSREKLLGAIIEAFEEEYELFLSNCDLSDIKERYNARLVNCGREVCVLDPKGAFSGVARGINNAGELLVELPDGKLTAVYAGEVSVRGVYGYV